MLRYEGRIVALEGLRIEVSGPPAALRGGAVARLGDPAGGARAEVVGFAGHRGVMLACDPVEDVRPGTPVYFGTAAPVARPCRGWLGRVIGAFGEPRDGRPPPPLGSRPMPLAPPPMSAPARARAGAALDLGVKALDLFVPCAAGQRLGLFAGSGVGKSMLLSMLARHCRADMVVIGLIGERGREVREFVEDTLGVDGLARAVVVTATSDEPAPRRRRAARLALSVAEFFRDEGLDVLCLLDSVTRFAQAQREIGLAAGEPPVARGFTPSVLAELPKLLERAGPGMVRRDGRAGSITGFFTVLVEGDDLDEPVADAVRGILDGHAVMSRRLAERGRHPAIDPLRSVSRLATRLFDPEQTRLIGRMRRLLSVHDDMEEMIRIGAYSEGADPALDEAVAIMPDLERFLTQDAAVPVGRADAFAELSRIAGGRAAVPATTG